ncbi:ribbon-helix-helix domain-containing protein [Natroniella acetigena]|uniref:ribbon-helix-helix domain-containing protein n=1 Tax=Natroniella acetigena TaxID=52004 RepID=UPI00200AEA25|nr:ribbon-helix-helix domain-containing protein [Natroniella acetigena]MCK8828320.1 ribbon-helix-helix domain-containing protein [Natroniella acetigena]
MSKLFLSVRITKNFFTDQEITEIKKKIESYQSKSEFIRKAIKNYLKQDQPSSSLLETEEIKQQHLPNKELTEIKQLIKKNQLLLEELTKNNVNTNYHHETQEVYEGRNQEQKTEQVLNLLNDF